jgi:hypothetical protein
MGHRGQRWNDLAGDIRDVTGRVSAAIGGVLQTWRGKAALGAAESNTMLTKWADDMSLRADQIGAGLVQYTAAVQRAQAAIPPPEFATAEQHFRDGFDVIGSGGPSTAILLAHLTDDMKPDFDKERSAHAEAIRVMKTYASQSEQVHNDMPAFTDAPQAPAPDSGQSPAAPPPGERVPLWVPPDTSREDRPPVGDPGSGGAAGPGGAPADPTTAQLADPAFDNAGGRQPGFGPGGFGPGGTADSLRTGSGYPGSGGPGGFGGIGGGFGGTGGGGAGGPGVRGGVGPGAEPLAARGGSGPAGLAGRGAGGAGGAGSMYPPFGGTGAQGDEDSEHTDKYNNGLDLFDDLPPAYPPVFGA